jgi:hypothetical protein
MMAYWSLLVELQNLAALMAYSMICIPPIMQYCFGQSAPKRDPTPPDMIRITLWILAFTISPQILS